MNLSQRDKPRRERRINLRQIDPKAAGITSRNSEWLRATGAAPRSRPAIVPSVPRLFLRHLDTSWDSASLVLVFRQSSRTHEVPLPQSEATPFLAITSDAKNSMFARSADHKEIDIAALSANAVDQCDPWSTGADHCVGRLSGDGKVDPPDYFVRKVWRPSSYGFATAGTGTARRARAVGRSLARRDCYPLRRPPSLRRPSGDCETAGAERSHPGSRLCL